MALVKIYNNSYVGLKSDFPQNLPIGSTFVETDTKNMYGYDEEKKPFLIGSGAIDYRKLNNIGIKFHWSSYSNKAGNNSSVISARIKGKYDLLGVTLIDYSPLKNKPNDEVYTLLIDRYRSKSYKGDTGVDRKAGFKHETIPHDAYDNKRINKFIIDNSTMILDFSQDMYFKPFEDDFSDYHKYPAPTGVSNKRSQSYNIEGSVNRKGWVDLGFRIRVERKGVTLYETKHIGFIRMLATSNNEENDIKSIVNRIIYSIK